MTNEDRAAIIARLAHAGQTYGDETYFDGHIRKVVENVKAMKGATYGDVEVAYLHDVLEDTSMTTGELITLGFSQDTVRAVDTLTRLDGETYADYIERVAMSPGTSAKRVKIADLRANMNDDTPPSLLKRNKAALDFLLSKV
jgi:(p)ppGpp synthase/HD superfamily hydrolase